MLHFRRSFSNMIELHQQSGATTTTEKYRNYDSATTSSQDEVAAASDLLKEARYKKGGGLQAATQSYIKRSWSSKLEQQRAAITSIDSTQQTGTEFNEINCDEKSFPLLNQLGIPICKHIISILLKEIVLLSTTNQTEDLLSYNNNNGTTCHLININSCKSFKQSYESVRKKTSWLSNLPSLIVNSNVTEEEDERESTGAAWLLRVIGGTHRDEFVSTSESLGFPVVTKKMEATTAQAMWEDANISINSQRTILRYFKSTFGGSFVVPEKDIRQLGDEHVAPINDYFLSKEKKKIYFWTKPLSSTIVAVFKCFMQDASTSSLVDNTTTLDIVIGGDHGQGKFRCLLKLILRDADNTIIKTVVLKVGHIDCPKDTYDVLKLSIAPLINQYLTQIISLSQLIVRPNENDVIISSPTPA